jgi:cytochrome c oxidase subunit 1
VAVRAEPVPVTPRWYEGRTLSWLTTTDHKRIGILYIVTAYLFFLVGGVMALVIRLQLMQANETIVGPDTYNGLFTLHGTTMIFLFIVPVLAGFGNYLVPLMIGAKDVAFPRLNAMSYWFYVAGGAVLMASFFVKGGPAQAGWYAYPPLSGPGNSGMPFVGQDLWILGIHLTTISSLAGAVNFIVTIHNMRAPGMTWMRIPLFVWTIETYAVLLILALPSVTAAVTLLLLDRRTGTGFFLPDEGGSALLYQHLFWFFGHPEVYVMILPAFGMVSEIIPVFSRKPIFGYRAVAFSSIGIAFAGMLVWAHHMFTVGLPVWLNGFFALTSFAVAIPTSVKIFNWLATIWRGYLNFKVPLMFCLGLIGLFTIGGLSGIFVAAFPIDYQAHDSYYIVAHMHYVLFGGTAFGLFAGTYYWFPKITGRMYNERLAKWHFWLIFIGFNVTFFVQHLAGLMGMPRRIYTYDRGGSFEAYNLISTIGSWIMAVAILIFLYNMIKSWRSGPRVGNDPWGGDTLEWYTTSPPPPENFDKLPPITSARPLRDLRMRLARQR